MSDLEEGDPQAMNGVLATLQRRRLVERPGKDSSS
jgi:hypothetical protein